LAAIASTWLGESRRPAGGVSDAATGIGASGFATDVAVLWLCAAEDEDRDGVDALTEAAELAA
jgi:hypothetical protein